MKRLLALSLLVAGFSVFAPLNLTRAEDMMHCEDFGGHVSGMAKEGMIGIEHNPGMHQGYSSCLDVHK